MCDAIGKIPKVLLLALFFVLWFAALLAVLSCEPYLGNVGHSLCGPWGCGSATEALLAYHGFWLVLLGGVALLAIAFWQPSTLSLVGAVLFFLGFCGAVAIAGWEIAHLTPRLRPYAFQRIGFVLVSEGVDLPMIQTTLVGALMWLGGRTKRRLASRRPVKNKPTQADESDKLTTS